MARILPPGKLPTEVLERLLTYTSTAPELSVPAAAGEDAAVAAGSATIVLTADPITFTEERIGAYVVAVNANDIVAMGGRPVYLTTTLLAPPGTTDARLEEVFADIAGACRQAGMLWAGGHTEITPAVNRIVVAGQAVGFLSGPPLATSGARPGDAIGMSKWAGLEGTTLIARERPRESEAALGAARYRAVLDWLERPGISIIAEGRALEGLELTSGHDPTEGGIAMGVHEIARRSGCGALVSADRIPVREETRRLCSRFGLDPLGLLGSGVFMFTAPRATAEEACRRLEAAAIPAALIGEVLDRGEQVWIEREGRREPLAYSVQDEIMKLEAGSERPARLRIPQRRRWGSWAAGRDRHR
jgi:hydrogenase expression/formation protein HypE